MKIKNTKSATSKRYLAALACLALAFAVLAPPAQAGSPVRQGFTLELGLGGSFTHFAFDGPDDLNEFSHSMLMLSLGGFINEDWALMFHMSGTTAYKSHFFGDTILTNQFVGAAVQYWLSESFYLSGGVGLGLFGLLFRDDSEHSTDTGLALSARAGYAFLTTRHHSLRVAIEVIPSFFDSRTVVGSALNLEWQYY